MSFEFRDRLESVDLTSLNEQKVTGRNESTALLITDELPRGLLRFKHNESRSTSHLTSENMYLWKDIMVLTFANSFFNITYYGLLFNLLALQPFQLVLTMHSMNFSSQIVCSLFLSHFIYHSISCKTSIIVSLTMIIIYAASQFYPTYGTFIPAAILIGGGFVTLRITSLQYGNLLSRYYVASSVEVVPSITYIIFVCVNYVPICGGIIGTLLPAIILTDTDESENVTGIKQNFSSICVSNNCNHIIKFDYSEYSKYDLSILNTVYILTGGLSVLIALFLNGRKELEDLFMQEHSSMCEQWTVVTSELIVTNVRLPLLTLVSGLIFSYSVVDLAQVLTCSNHPNLTSFLSTAQLSLFFATIILISIFTKNINLSIMSPMTCLLCFLLLLLQILLKTENTSIFIIFFIEACFGFINGLFFVVNHVEWGSMKSSGEVTYNVCFSLFSLGCVLGCAWKIIICTLIKLYIYMGFLCLTFILYLISIILQCRPGII